MRQSTPAALDLARLLLALEASESEHAEAEANAALSIFEKLRASLSKIVGVAGFQALLARALALAKAEADWLEAVRIQPDATLTGLSEVAQQQPANAVAEGYTALVAHLLGLLVTFVGEALTLCLVRDIWPEARLDDINLGAGE